MRTTELKGYGLTGVKVELNLMDCYEASHLLERVNHLQGDIHTLEEGEPLMDVLSETMCILGAMNVFLEKIALKPTEMPSIFLPKEDENDEKECYK